MDGQSKYMVSPYSGLVHVHGLSGFMVSPEDKKDNQTHILKKDIQLLGELACACLLIYTNGFS